MNQGSQKKGKQERGPEKMSPAGCGVQVNGPLNGHASRELGFKDSAVVLGIELVRQVDPVLLELANRGTRKDLGNETRVEETGNTHLLHCGGFLLPRSLGWGKEGLNVFLVLSAGGDRLGLLGLQILGGGWLFVCLGGQWGFLSERRFQGAVSQILRLIKGGLTALEVVIIETTIPTKSVRKRKKNTTK